jgi:hypothetical protein
MVPWPCGFGPVIRLNITAGSAWIEREGEREREKNWSPVTYFLKLGPTSLSFCLLSTVPSARDLGTKKAFNT